MDELARKDRNFYIRMMVKDGRSYEFIADFYNLTLEQVIKIAEED